MSYAHYNISDLIATLGKLERGVYVTPWERANFYLLLDKTDIKNEHLKARIDKYLEGIDGTDSITEVI